MRFLFSEDPFDVDEMGEFVFFTADLSLIWNEVTHKLGEKFASVKDLAQYLMDSESSMVGAPDGSEPDEDELDEDEWDGHGYDEEWEYKKGIQRQKEQFVKDACEGFKSIDDIGALCINRSYFAYGEEAELVADNDGELCELAEKVMTSTGDERKKALEEMAAYANGPRGGQWNGDFAGGCEIEYEWSGDPNDLIPIAKRLCSSYGPGSVSGSEERRLDFRTGKITEHATFELK